jgi:hypothetical protein
MLHRVERLYFHPMQHTHFKVLILQDMRPDFPSKIFNDKGDNFCCLMRSLAEIN